MSKKLGSTVILAMTVGALVATLVFGAVAAAATVDGSAVITAPAPNAQVSGRVVVTGTATATDFQFYKLEFGVGASPTQWSVIGSLQRTQVTRGTLGTWDAAALPAGAYTLRLSVVDHTGNWIESSVLLSVGAVVIPTRQATLPVVSPTPPVKPIAGLTLVPLPVQASSAPFGSSPDRGVIQGRVLDSSGRGVSGLSVKVTRSGFQQTAPTGDDGDYEIAGLEPGTYTAVVEGQISTPAQGLNLEAGQALQVDFVQIRPPSATVPPTRTPGPSPTVLATPTRAPTPLPPAATISPTATPRVPAISPLDVSRWWGWLGMDLDLGGLASHLYLGIAGGFLIFVVGALVVLVRR